MVSRRVPVMQNYGSMISVQFLNRLFPTLNHHIQSPKGLRFHNPVNTGSAATDWEVTSGNLPEGLSLSSVDGSTGTPTNIGGPASVILEQRIAVEQLTTISFTVNQRCR